MLKCPVQGTYCSNPEATHTVTTGDPRFGYGIFGYYTSEWNAVSARRWLLKHKCQNVSFEAYDPKAPVVPGIHPMIQAHRAGHI